MMKHFRKSGGFTLVELVVSIAVASLVTMAATTVLMLALRVNRQTSDTASQQNTVRALLTTMEKAATDGNIKKVVSKLDSWQLLKDDEEAQPIFEYIALEKKILANGVAVLEGVYASNAILEENGLLSISIETKEGIFESTVYCRLGNVDQDSTKPTAPDETETTLNRFVAILISQLNSNGKINYDNLKEILSKPEAPYVPKSQETYYSEWYIGGYETAPNWDPSTPWCACYVSWALVEAGMDYPRIVNDTTVHWYSHVDEFEKHFRAQVDSSIWKLRGEEISKGALVFFNLDQDIEADHIGVVYEITQDEEGNEYIITIEGNSAGRVAMRRYPINDDRILGYGVLSWS